MNRQQTRLSTNDEILSKKVEKVNKQSHKASPSPHLNVQYQVVLILSCIRAQEEIGMMKNITEREFG